MKFTGALVKLKDKVIGVAVVDKNFSLLSQPEKIAMLRKYTTAFPENTPVILMVETNNDEPEFFGRPDLLDQMKEVPLTYITWKPFTLKEDL